MLLFKKKNLNLKKVNEILSSEKDNKKFLKFIKKVSYIIMSSNKETTYFKLKEKIENLLKEKELNELKFLDEAPELVFGNKNNLILNFENIINDMNNIWIKLFNIETDKKKKEEIIINLNEFISKNQITFLKKEEISKNIEKNKEIKKESIKQEISSQDNSDNLVKEDIKNLKNQIKIEKKEIENSKKKFNLKIKKIIKKKEEKKTETIEPIVYKLGEISTKPDSKLNEKLIIDNINSKLTPEMKNLTRLIMLYNTKYNDRTNFVEILVVHNDSNIGISNDLQIAYENLINSWTSEYNKKAIIYNLTYSDFQKKIKTLDPFLFNIYEEGKLIYDNQTYDFFEIIYKNKKQETNEKLFSEYLSIAKKYSSNARHKLDVYYSLLYLSYAILIKNKETLTLIDSINLKLKKSKFMSKESKELISLTEKIKDVKNLEEVKEIQNQVIKLISNLTEQ